MEPYGTLIGYGLNQMNTVYGGLFNFAQQLYQNDYNYKMWQRNNQYNSPSAQLARLLVAGVPYNTAIQSIAGGAVGQQTSNSPAESAPYTPMQPPSLQDSMAVQSAMDNHDLVQSQAAKNYAEAHDIDPTSPYGKARLQAKLNEAVLTLSESDFYKSDIGLNEEKKKEIMANRRLLNQQAMVQHQQFKKLLTENKYFSDFQEKALRKLSAETGIAEQECANYMQRINASIKAQIAQARLNNANAAISEDTLESIVQKSTYDAFTSQYTSESARFQSYVDELSSIPAVDYHNRYSGKNVNYADWLGYAKTYAQYEAYKNTHYNAPFPHASQAVRYPAKNKGGIFN